MPQSSDYRRIRAGIQCRKDCLRDLVRSEGQKMCSLDKDEADTLFDSCHHYVRRLFAHPDLLDVARRFSAHISDRRILTKTKL